MKRRITVEQLNELSDEQKLNLHSLWEPQQGDFKVTNEYGFELPLLDIGQMIEMLQSNRHIHLFGFEPADGSLLEREDICDYLFNVVKEVLLEKGESV